MSAWGELRPAPISRVPPEAETAAEHDGGDAQAPSWPGLPVPCRKCTGRGDAHYLTCSLLQLGGRS